MKKIALCLLSLLICFAVIACELPSSNVSLGSNGENQDVPLETAAPLTVPEQVSATAAPVPAETQAPVETQAPAGTAAPAKSTDSDENFRNLVNTLVSDRWVDTDDQSTTLTFYEDGTGIGTCKDNGELYTNVRYDLLWKTAGESGTIEVTYYYYVQHVSAFRLDTVDGIPVLASVNSDRTYRRSSDF